MPIELHDKCKERLLDVLTEHLPKLTITNGMFLERGSAIYLILADQALPNQRDLKLKLEQFISEIPLFDFICHYLAKEIRELDSYNQEVKQQFITDLPIYKDIKSTATRILTDFLSLPRQYCFTIPAGDNISKIAVQHLGTYSISDNMRLLCPNTSDVGAFEMKSDNKIRDRDFNGQTLLSLRIGAGAKWDTNAAYLQFELDGYVDAYGSTNTADRAIATLKTFFGLCIASRMLKVNTSHRPRLAGARFWVHEKMDDNWAAYTGFELDIAASQIYYDLALNDLNGKLDNTDKLSEWMRTCLNNISLVFKHPNKSTRIASAAQWLYDGYSGKNDLLSFVQLTVVLEILLGDKNTSDIIGIGELLRNRCAYLISKNHNERVKILDMFKSIYDVRSKIVHRGKNRLTYEERGLFSQLKWICRRVIQEEMILLKSTIESESSK